MAKIKVKSGMFGRSLVEALAISKPGDTIALSEGEYVLDSLRIKHLTIVGVGDASKVVLHTQCNVHGVGTLSNLTIQAPHFHNAVHLPFPGARVTLNECVLYGDPAGKYPAVYCKGGAVSLTGCEVRNERTSPGVTVEESSSLTVAGSTVGRLLIRGSRAGLSDVSAYSVACEQRAQVHAAGVLAVDPGEKQRSLVITGESVCSVDYLRAMTATREGFCQESSLQIGGVEVPQGETYLVVKNGKGGVRTESQFVQVQDQDEPAKPKDVRWRLADSRAFKTAVAPHINKGDTVVLDEGAYFLEDHDNVVTIGVHLRGQGAASRTVINGCLNTMRDCDISLSNCTIRGTSDSNALQVVSGSSLSMTNVIIEGSRDIELPAVYLAAGTNMTMSDSTIESSKDVVHGYLNVDKGARLKASGSSLGWMRVSAGSSATLDGCTSRAIWADGDSEVTSESRHFLTANTCSMRPIAADTGATVRLDQVETDIVELDVLSNGGHLRINALTLPGDGTATVHLKDGGTADVRGATVTVVDSDAPTVGSATAAGTDGEVGSPEGDVSTDSYEDGDPLDQIMALTGLAAVKEQIRGFTQMVRFNRMRAQQGLRTTELSMHSMFLGNPGTGKTTVARLLGKVLFQAGAIQSETFVEVGRRDLVSDRLGASAIKTVTVLEQARGGVLFIDEAYSLYQARNNEFAQEAVDALIAFMENNRDSIVVIFAGYAEQMHDFLRMNPGLHSRVPNRFDFEDYTPAEIAEIGYRDLLSNDYSVDEELYRRIVSTQYGQSVDRSNGRWVRNFNESAVKEMVRRVFAGSASGAQDLMRISDEDLFALAGGSSEDKALAVESLLEELDRMVGLTPVKTWVRGLVNRVQVDRQLLELEGSATRPTYHMVFAGNAGTGKTTVAAIVAKLFYNLGVLQNPHVKEVERSGLVGTWLGHTEQKTAKAVDEAMGGVLFVDEAYQLHVADSTNDFGKMAIETLVTRLENDRDKFVAIFAGYTTQMEKFLDANAGLRSRIPLVIEFPDFSPEDVGRIVVSHLSENWEFDRELVAEVAAEAYAGVAESERSNGRWARTFAERIETVHSNHAVENRISGVDLKRIPPEVVRAAAAT